MALALSPAFRSYRNLVYSHQICQHETDDDVWTTRERA